MIWNEAMETMPRAEIERLQSSRLRELAMRVHENVPFYQKKFREAGIEPASIESLADLTRLPFTVKSDLRDHYPFGLFATPMEQVIRIHASSGTTGKPTVVGYTRKDIQTWAEVCARCLALSGARPGEMLQNAYGYGLFTGGLGIHYGAEHMGVTVIPVSGGNTARQVMLIKDFSPHIITCTPSYALTLVDRLMAEGLDLSSLKLKTFILGAEPWTQEMRKAIEARIPVDAVNIYGLSEVIGPGVSNECVEAKNGSHVFEDHFIVEAIDPGTGEPVPDGNPGELVFTTLTKEAMPLIRYRTGDLASLDREPCVCGRTHARMSRIMGRIDDMLIIKGVNVFPSQIETVLVGMDGLAPHHQIIVTRAKHQDHLEVRVEVTDRFEGMPDTPAWKDLNTKIRQGLHEMLGLNVQVTLLTPGALPRSEGGKLSRVVDKRDLA